MSSDKIFTLGKRVKSGESTIDGSPYLNGKDFEKVYIDGYTKELPEMRYNAYSDEMEFYNKNEVYYIDKLEDVVINFPKLNKSYIVKKYRYSGNTVLGYLVLLSKKNSKLSLLKREKVELIAGEKSPNAYSKDSNDYFVKEKDLYLVSNGENLFKLPKNIDDLAVLLGLNKNDLKQYIKSNKLNYNTEQGLVEVFNYINKM